MAEYDYLIVGSGLFGSVFAFEATRRGKKCLVIEKRNHLGGNVYCENIEGINVHKYGPHIFHTNDKAIWDYVNSFVEFNRFTYSPVAVYGNKIYNLPFNMNTFYQLWGVTTPEQAQNKIQQQVAKLNIKEPANLEEQALLLVGPDIYETLIKGYTEKQWGRKATALPQFIIKRLPVRFTYDNNYFNDKYQGIPVGGYTKLVEGLLRNIEVKLNCDFFTQLSEWESKAEKIIYTGPIDNYFNFQYGHLEYRSLRFEQEILEMKNYQGNAVINYTHSDIPYTRCIEHKHFEFGNQDHTIITREYPQEWQPGMEPYYPINDERNMNIYKKYQELSKQYDHVLFGGRLSEYRYYDMHQVIGAAFVAVKKEFSSCCF